MDLVITFAKNLSLLLFVAVLLMVYYSVPEEISLVFNEIQQPVQGISREQMFYIAAFFVIAFNMLLVIFIRLMSTVPWQYFKIPHHDFWMKDKESREKFFFVLQSWAYSFIAAVNLFACFVLYRVYDININLQRSDSMWGTVALGLLIFIGWLAFIFVRFGIRKWSIFDGESVLE
jgi:hypothetical protein